MRKPWVAFSLLCLSALWFFALGAAPDWQVDKPVREEFYFEYPQGTFLDGISHVRGYIRGADTSSVANHIDFAYSAACSCFTENTLIRSSVLDIYLVSTSPHHLIRAEQFVIGLRERKAAVDDTSLCAASVDSSKMVVACVPLSKLKTKTPGSNGQFLQKSGGGIDWATVAGSGTVTSVGRKAKSGMTVSGDTLVAPRFGVDTTFVATKTYAASVGGSGSGDITGVGVLPAGMLEVNADSLRGKPLLGINKTQADARWVNEAQANSIDSAMVAAGALSWTDLLVPGGVVSAAKLSSTAVDSSKCATGTMSWTDLKIPGGGVTAAMLSSTAVDSSKSATGTLSWGDLKVPGRIISNAMLAATAVDSSKVPDGTLSWDDLKANLETADTLRLGPSTVTSRSIKDGQVKKVDLGSDAVDSTKAAGESWADLTGALHDSLKLGLNLIPKSRLALTGQRHATYSNLRIDTATQRLYAGPDSVGAGGAADTTNLTTHTEDSNQRFKGTLTQTGLLTANGGLTVAGTVTLPTDAVQSTAIDWGDVMNGIRQRPYYYNDFTNGYSSALLVGLPWNTTVIASGASATSTVVATSSHPGVNAISSAASSGSGLGFLLPPESFLLGGGETTELVFKSAPTTKAASGFLMRFGFLDATNATAPVDGVYLQESCSADQANVDSLKFKGRTCSNSTRDSTATGYTIVKDTWYRLRVALNSDASKAYFRIWRDTDPAASPVWLDSLATNIPTGAGRFTGNGVIITNYGAVAEYLMYIDWIAMWFDGRSLTR